jgi:hypothetical protein
MERAYLWVHKQPHLVKPAFTLDYVLPEEARRCLDGQEFLRHVEAVDLRSLQLDNGLQHRRDHNHPSYVYKCLGAAILTLRRAIRFAKLGEQLPSFPSNAYEVWISDVIMEGGHSTANAAVCGAVLGAYFGYLNIPSHWKGGLANREWLALKVVRLA